MKGGKVVSDKTDYKVQAVIAMRVFQLLCVGLLVSGFVWASSDYLLTTVLVDAPVTPLSVLLMVYGLLGIVCSEVSVRLVRRQNEKKG